MTVQARLTPRPVNITVRADRAPMTGLALGIGGAIGTAAAFVLIVEKIYLLQDPNYVPSCSLNPIVSCGSVMSTGQAEVLGFPNPLLGVAAFPLVTAFGIAVLNRTQFPAWMWRTLNVGSATAVVFVHWLMFQSLYRIGALCPYCMAVWLVTVIIFWYVTLHCWRHRYWPTPARWRRAAARLAEYHLLAVILWAITVATLIIVRFWDYWSTLW